MWSAARYSARLFTGSLPIQRSNATHAIVKKQRQVLKAIALKDRSPSTQRTAPNSGHRREKLGVGGKMRPMSMPDVSSRATPARSQANRTPDSVVQLTQRVRKRRSDRESQQSKPKENREPKRKFLSDRELVAYERKGHFVTKALLHHSDVDEVKQVTAADRYRSHPPPSCLERHQRLALQVLEGVIERRSLDALRHRVRVLCPGVQPEQIRSQEEAAAVLESRGIEPVGFLQFFNTWRLASLKTSCNICPSLTAASTE